MLIPCDVLRPFLFSEDGFTSRPANVGVVSEIPADLVPGLVASGHVRAKSIGTAPENKAIQSAPENKTVRHIGRGRYAVFEGDRRVTVEPLEKAEAERMLGEASE